MSKLLDSLIAAGIIGAFFYIIGTKVYSHEKDHIDPLLEKFKGLFNREEDIESSNDGDYNITFEGKTEI